MDKNYNAAICADNYAVREKKIRKWFSMWLSGDSSRMEEIFAGDAVYVECTGNEYRGIQQIMRWFAEWFDNGEVKRWDIKNIYHSGDRSFVEWYFECVCYDKLSAFDGMTAVTFDVSDRISSLCEYSAEHQHTLPYGE